MYSKIVNPLTDRKVSINGKLGRSILRNYLNVLSGGAEGAVRSMGYNLTSQMTGKIPPPTQELGVHGHDTDAAAAATAGRNVAPKPHFHSSLRSADLVGRGFEDASSRMDGSTRDLRQFITEGEEGATLRDWDVLTEDEIESSKPIRQGPENRTPEDLDSWMVVTSDGLYLDATKLGELSPRSFVRETGEDQPDGQWELLASPADGGFRGNKPGVDGVLCGVTPEPIYSAGIVRDPDGQGNPHDLEDTDDPLRFW